MLKPNVTVIALIELVGCFRRCAAIYKQTGDMDNYCKEMASAYKYMDLVYGNT